MKKHYIAYFIVDEEQITIEEFDSLDEALKCLESQKRHDIQLGMEKDYYGISVEEW